MMDQGHLGHTLNAGDTEDTLWTLFLRTLGSLVLSEEDIKGRFGSQPSQSSLIGVVPLNITP